MSGPKRQQAARNRFPRSDRAEIGTLGDGEVRFRLERGLIPVHGLGDERWKNLGYDLDEIANRKEDIIRALRSMIAHPDRRRYINRSAAIGVLGLFQRGASLPLLESVMRSPSETEVVQGWAALTIGRVGRARSVELLETTYRTAPPMLRRFLIYGLEAARCREAVPALKRVVEAEANPVLCEKAVSAVRDLEKRFKMPRSRLGRGRSRGKSGR